MIFFKFCSIVFIEGKIGKIIANIQENGYTIAGLRMHRLSLSDAELFFEAYKDVWEDHPVSSFTFP